MKKAILILFVMAISVTSSMSQTTNHYVIQTEPHDDIMYIYMDPIEYGRLSEIGKNALIKRETRENDVKNVYVISGHNRELWQKTNGLVVMVDSWDMDTAESLLASGDSPSTGRSLQHPWFFNISGALGSVKSEGSSTISVYGYSRLGCYLFKGRWDLALNGLLGYSKIIGKNEGTKSSSFGIDTRVYILKGKVINPFAGVGLAYSSNGGESSLTIPVSAGASIPVSGKGCIDACYQYNKVTKSTIIVGFTHMF